MTLQKKTASTHSQAASFSQASLENTLAQTAPWPGVVVVVAAAVVVVASPATQARLRGDQEQRGVGHCGWAEKRLQGTSWPLRWHSDASLFQLHAVCNAHRPCDRNEPHAAAEEVVAAVVVVVVAAVEVVVVVVVVDVAAVVVVVVVVVAVAVVVVFAASLTLHENSCAAQEQRGAGHEFELK